MAPMLEAFTMLDRTWDKVCGSAFIITELCNRVVYSSSECSQ